MVVKQMRADERPNNLSGPYLSRAEPIFIYEYMYIV